MPCDRAAGGGDGIRAPPSRALELYRCPVGPPGCHQNVAVRYLINSRRKILIFSGTITVFFHFIASARKGGEAKRVERGSLRARIPYRGGWGVKQWNLEIAG